MPGHDADEVMKARAQSDCSGFFDWGAMNESKWQFWIDRGGTFTDVVALDPAGQVITHKLLSENPEHYRNSALQGIRDILGLDTEDTIPHDQLGMVKVGTTVATNALLERKGEKTLLLTTKGYADALRIGYQNRPDLFAMDVQLPELLYSAVLEVDERVDAGGNILVGLDAASIEPLLRGYFHKGFQSVAIVLMHGYRYPDHEKRLGQLARDCGFRQVSLSHEVSPTVKLIQRGDTTVVDAYLTPVMRRYVDQIAAEIQQAPIYFMQSNGGLALSHHFQGKDAILSGPAGGVIGAIKTAKQVNESKIIGFDMGGTSTDVCHFAGELERQYQTEVAGVRLAVPMMAIHTVAAGGGSICKWEDGRLQVGPESAGANPGPACYRRGGPLTVTDCNLLLGKIHPDHFPHCFGPHADQPLDPDVVKRRFVELCDTINLQSDQQFSPEEIAAGFLQIAVDNMANAVKRISTQKGHDLSQYSLNCFGGAGGQHACQVAEQLGIRKVLIHPHAGVLSALGIGLADQIVIKRRSFECALLPENEARWQAALATSLEQAETELRAQVVTGDIQQQCKLHLRYVGTDSSLPMTPKTCAEMTERFHQTYLEQFGFQMLDRPIELAEITVEVSAHQPAWPMIHSLDRLAGQVARAPLFHQGKWHDAQLIQRQHMAAGQRISGPAIIIEHTGTNLVEPGWSAILHDSGMLFLNQDDRINRERSTERDPIRLEIFNNLFMNIAEQMGEVLASTAYSVNIKERLDFSCALFNQSGQLISNAPHMPVHLGSMSHSVEALIEKFGDEMSMGDGLLLNSPYHGGTHLPDLTLVTPVFCGNPSPQFYVASRAHHADVGGMTPGSMPAFSGHIDEEGLVFTGVRIARQGELDLKLVRDLFSAGVYPARNVDQNIADLKAQLGANMQGVKLLDALVSEQGLKVVQAYMQHVQDNAEESVRRALHSLGSGQFHYAMDQGQVIQVAIDIDHVAETVVVDFTGTSSQQDNNLNAPEAITYAAVIYVFRCLVDKPIPLNAGCLRPIDIRIPQGSMLSPQHPAAVVAGNVETSQAIVNALFGALGKLAAAQGTMNNFVFGDDQYQYYETIAGGYGAGQQINGCDAVHSHMTNSRLTDPEVLENRYPILLEEFAIRRDSGGRGQWHGGNGVARRIRFLQPMQVSILSNHRKVPPFGLKGGQPGAVGENWLIKGDERSKLAGMTEVAVDAQDAICILTPGGGGFGSTESG